MNAQATGGKGVVGGGLLRAAQERLAQTTSIAITGNVSAIRGMTAMVQDLPVPVGSLVELRSNDGRQRVPGEVIATANQQAVVMVMGQTEGLGAGMPVRLIESAQTAGVGRMLLGRVLNGMGEPIDGKGPLRDRSRVALSPPPLPALSRGRVHEQLVTGVRAIDLMTPLGKGQRMGIFAGPGVGKSTLLGAIATCALSEVNVIALIGERGREVRDFIEVSLGPAGLARSVVVVATGDESPLMRVRAAKLACSCAEWFRDQGHDALLMMDSVTRFAHAQRQIGLSAGEPPTTKGYTPSVFAGLGLLLERAGNLEPRAGQAGEKPVRAGSVTGIYTILVDGDDMTEPIADAARGILDGHIILSRKLAQRGHFPAIDVLDSVSRVANDITDRRCGTSRRMLQRMLALYREVDDLIQIGAYAKGAKLESDVAVEYAEKINMLLRQSMDEPVEATRAGFPVALAAMHQIATDVQQKLSAVPGKR